MTTRELFKKRVIELIHGLPYEEAVKLEPDWDWDRSCEAHVTLSQIMSIMYGINAFVYISYKDECQIKIELPCGDYEMPKYKDVCDWRVVNLDGATTTDDDQTDETIEELYKLIK